MTVVTEVILSEKCIALGIKALVNSVRFGIICKKLEPIPTLDAMLASCLPLSSLLQSSLLCFYRQDCLHRVCEALNLDMIAPNLNITTLNSSIESRFKADSSLDSIINALFVET